MLRNKPRLSPWLINKAHSVKTPKKLFTYIFIVSSVYLDPQADFVYFFSPRKKNTAMSTNMDRSPCLARHTPFRRLEIDDTITFKLSTKKKPKNRAARGAAGMFC
jgi:hypothetical protein